MHSEINLIFGRLVRAFRRRLELSQTTFAAELGTERSHLARVEGGRNLANIDDVLRIESALSRRGLLPQRGYLCLLAAQVEERLATSDLEASPEMPGLKASLAKIDAVISELLEGIDRLRPNCTLAAPSR